MKGIMLSCVFDVDETKYNFIAFDHQGHLCGFVNPPVRDYKNLEWVDSATGDLGDLIPYIYWDKSMRETAECHDMHKNGSTKPSAPVAMGVQGKRYLRFKRNEEKNGRT